MKDRNLMGPGALLEERAVLGAHEGRILHGAHVGFDPGVIEGSDLRQDLNQVLSTQLAGSTAGRNERRQSDRLAHDLPLRTRPSGDVGARNGNAWRCLRFAKPGATIARCVQREFGAESRSIDLDYFNGDAQDLDRYIGEGVVPSLIKITSRISTIDCGPDGIANGVTWKGTSWPKIGISENGKYYRIEGWIRVENAEEL